MCVSYSVPMNRGWDWIEQVLLLILAAFLAFVVIRYLQG